MMARRRRRQRNLLTSLLKTPMRKKVAAAQRRTKWPLPWRLSSMTSFDVENIGTQSQEKDNKKNQPQSPDKWYLKILFFCLGISVYLRCMSHECVL